MDSFAHVFISYSRKNKEYARQLAEALRKNGFNVWIDHSIEPGVAWLMEIEKAIVSCGAFIIIMSDESRTSEWCQREIQLARDKKKRIFPILLQGEVFFSVNELHYVNALHGELPPEDFYKNLSELIPRMPQSGRILLPTSTPNPGGRGVGKAKKRFWVLVLVLLVLFAFAGLLLFASGDGEQKEALATATNPPTPTLLPTPEVTPSPDVASATEAAIPTPSPLQLAEQGIQENAEWTPYTETINEVVMALVPSGCFMMGITEDTLSILAADNGADVQALIEDELPQHEVCFEAPFWIGQYEVSNAEYQAFIQAGGYDDPIYWTEAGWEWRLEENRLQNLNYGRTFDDPQQPVVGVTWYEALAFANWKGMNLPTEAQWEYAASGPQGLMYPWGNTFVPVLVVYEGRGFEYPAPITAYPEGASWVGALAMSGNVWEWAVNVYDQTRYPYPFEVADGRTDLDSNLPRALRGGSWWNRNDYTLRTTYRSGDDPDSSGNGRGIRLVCPYDCPARTLTRAE